jgi:hypothetical protein
MKCLKNQTGIFNLTFFFANGVLKGLQEEEIPDR